MSKFNQERTPAVWNLVQQRDNIRVYVSDKAHMKVVRLTDKGLEQMVAMFSGRDLETLTGINDLLVLAQADVNAKLEQRAKDQEQERIQAQYAKVLEKAAKQVQAARDAMLAAGVSLEEVNKLFPIKAA